MFCTSLTVSSLPSKVAICLLSISSFRALVVLSLVFSFFSILAISSFCSSLSFVSPILLFDLRIASAKVSVLFTFIEYLSFHSFAFLAPNCKCFKFPAFDKTSPPCGKLTSMPPSLCESPTACLIFPCSSLTNSPSSIFIFPPLGLPIKTFPFNKSALLTLPPCCLV